MKKMTGRIEVRVLAQVLACAGFFWCRPPLVRVILLAHGELDFISTLYTPPLHVDGNGLIVLGAFETHVGSCTIYPSTNPDTSVTWFAHERGGRLQRPCTVYGIKFEIEEHCVYFLAMKKYLRYELIDHSWLKGLMDRAVAVNTSAQG